MEYRRFGQDLVLRIQRGEEILAAIEEVAKQESVTLGSVTAIGACNYAKLGFYQLSNKEYSELILEEDMELTSLVGNITLKDGQYYGHYHANFGKEDGTVHGGHLVAAKVSVTCEVFIHVIEGQVDRQADPETGINLIEFI